MRRLDLDLALKNADLDALAVVLFGGDSNEKYCADRPGLCTVGADREGLPWGQVIEGRNQGPALEIKAALCVALPERRRGPGTEADTREGGVKHQAGLGLGGHREIFGDALTDPRPSTFDPQTISRTEGDQGVVAGLGELACGLALGGSGLDFGGGWGEDWRLCEGLLGRLGALRRGALEEYEERERCGDSEAARGDQWPSRAPINLQNSGLRSGLAGSLRDLGGGDLLGPVVGDDCRHEGIVAGLVQVAVGFSELAEEFVPGLAFGGALGMRLFVRLEKIRVVAGQWVADGDAIGECLPASIVVVARAHAVLLSARGCST